ncbi:MAG: hypothetical protein HOP19_25995 [Acidobacteria bacterium]|nr:hypothetical protein [Acidobacteriota bacterium]
MKETTRWGQLIASVFLNVLCSCLIAAQSKWPAFETVSHDIYPNVASGKILGFSGCLRLLDGRIYCAGATVIDASAKFVPSAETAIFDPRTSAWKQAAPLAEARRLQVMSLLPDGRVLMAGGYNGIPDSSGYPISAVQSAEIYDPYNNRSERIATPDYNWRAMYSALLVPPVSILLPDARLLIISRQSGGVDSSIILDWKTGQIERVPNPPLHSGIRIYVLSLLGDGRVLLSSHLYEQTGMGVVDAAPVLGIFDPVAKQWTQITWPDPKKFLYWVLLPSPSFQSSMLGNQLVGYYFDTNSSPKSYLTYLDLDKGLTTGFEITPLTETSEPLITMAPSDWGEILVSGRDIYPENKDRIYNVHNQSVTYLATPKEPRGAIPLANGDFWGLDYRYANQADNPLNAVVTSSGSYAIKPFARGSLITLFGDKMVEGQGVPEMSLLTTTKEKLPVRMIYASPTQINAVLPDQEGIEGRALLCLTQAQQTKCTPITVVRTAPDVLTADASGRGAAAALFYRAKRDGSMGRYEPVTTLENGKLVLVPARPPAEDEVLFLVLYGTGWRNRAAANGRLKEGVSVYCNDTAMQVPYAGAQGTFFGLDQMNIQIPPALKGRQVVQVLADGKLANPVEIALRD